MTTATDNGQQPLVSFILTCYNLPTELLCQCIDSILRLSLRPDEREIIVVDDGSDQSPMNDLLRYGDDITYVRKKNGGLSTARNQGLEVASGTYVQFVDGDDQLIRSPYDHCLDIIRRHGDTDMVLFDFSEQNDTAEQAAAEVPEAVSGTDYMRHNNIHGMACGYLARRMTIADLRFTPGIYHEDEEFTPLLLIRAEKVFPTTEKAYYYNKRPGSITTSGDSDKRDKRMADRLTVIRHLKETADRRPLSERLALERRIAQLAMDLIYGAIVQSQSLPYTKEMVEQLRPLGLYPLPAGDYTRKYKWFRRLSGSQTGLALLVRLLPHIQKER